MKAEPSKSKLMAVFSKEFTIVHCIQISMMYHVWRIFRIPVILCLCNGADVMVLNGLKLVP